MGLHLDNLAGTRREHPRNAVLTGPRGAHRG